MMSTGPFPGTAKGKKKMARFCIFHFFSKGMFLKHFLWECSGMLASNGHILQIYNTFLD